MEDSFLEDPGDGRVIIRIRLQPRGSRSSIEGLYSGEGWGVGKLESTALKVKLTAPPVDGAANRSLISFISKLLHIPRSSVRIISGERSRMKRVEVEGITTTEVRGAIEGRLYKTVK